MTLVGREGVAEVSVLVPAKDEEENLPEFVRLCGEALAGQPYPCEVVIVNDGSEDGTATVLERLRSEHAFLRVVTHRTRQGIADALRSAADAASGSVFVFYPADLQFLPSEIPDLVEPIRTGKADIVTGAKQGAYEKAFVSRVYNWLCRRLFGIRVTDLNAVKAYRRSLMDVVGSRPDWHRFMVVIGHTEGFRVTERAVTLLPRKAGVSKFGLARIPAGLLDLLSVWFQIRFGRRPMLFFGLSGGVLLLLGIATGIVAFVLRFGFGAGFRPLLYLVLMLVLSGLALFGVGFLGELSAGSREEIRGLTRAVDRLAQDLERRQP
ncbi:MAG: glycosyltransferase family 2 protein [Gemmatimonadota bacterium]|nr:glycosyltransferase family 2 protein [Gemmatimonadota bacterium]MDH4350672.1 glycosyltransferase family 2 protein [Gemmatimonadota bacterium]MDH5198216.1 glycosyltransferase family 2 protein [Gemmatimonadota bacterium]